jgi:hypothetical protein
MTDHPITPPPELVQDWLIDGAGKPSLVNYLATEAAQWGADQELEACCEWLVSDGWFRYEHEAVQDLRAARRPAPKPLSLKEEALGGLDQLAVRLTEAGVAVDLDTIRRALNELPDN